jgi:hypothetical protein
MWRGGGRRGAVFCLFVGYEENQAQELAVDAARGRHARRLWRMWSGCRAVENENKKDFPYTMILRNDDVMKQKKTIFDRRNILDTR